MSQPVEVPVMYDQMPRFLQEHDLMEFQPARADVCTHSDTTVEAGEPHRSGRVDLFLVCHECGASSPAPVGQDTVI